MKNILKYLFFSNAKLNVCIIRMGAIMDNSVHIQIEIVEFRNLLNKMYLVNILLHICYTLGHWHPQGNTDLSLLDQLTQARISLANVAEKLGHSHGFESWNFRLKLLQYF